MKIYTGIGSRETPSPILKDMTDIAQKLHLEGYTLRSGAAQGADSAFEAGAGGRVEIYLPWPRFNGHSSRLFPTPEAFTMAAKFHPAWDRCSRGAQALHARNCHQVLGMDLSTPSEFVVCWTRDGRASGGTGQAIRIAERFGIPVVFL
jgi:hypothetical protein